MKLLKLILAAAGTLLTARTLLRLKRKADKVKSEVTSRIHELEEEVRILKDHAVCQGPAYINNSEAVTPQVREVPVTTDIVDSNEITTTESIDGLAQLRVEKKE